MFTGILTHHAYFYPRSPCGERRRHTNSTRNDTNFYPRSPCGERPRLYPSRGRNRNFYPRSPCGERRRRLWLLAQTASFLSTLSLRRATSMPTAHPQPHTFLSTLSLRRATGTVSAQDRPKEFLSTLSLRRATDVIAVMTDAQSISIHALLAESDRAYQRYFAVDENFYPRSPCGERQPRSKRTNRNIAFLSTLSLRRATWADTKYNLSDIISIHALLAESDSKSAQNSGALLRI